MGSWLNFLHLLRILKYDFLLIGVKGHGREWQLAEPEGKGRKGLINPATGAIFGGSGKPAGIRV